ncbi:MAG TPA: xanthine dehydrogenase family protein subunit M [Alphaproteobacteria bacterium]|nr:xanthine dehydrogenase family protein subunit M [Alphaproteobacteria bacterium]
MIIKDAIPNFELYQPTKLSDALALLGKHGKDAWKLAGGNDSLTWFKERIKRPKVVVDLSGIQELYGIKETADGVEIGALTTLTEIERSPIIKSKYRLLADAARRVASPQIRNTGTLGGNISQDARCWYYRSGLPCYRAGGNTCFADTPEGVNRDHALFDTDRCVTVNPSDTAPALIALDAKMVVKSSKGERVVSTDDFFIGPKTDITHLTSVKPDELVVAIRIPKDWAGARFYFEKVADRMTWDFAHVNVAAAIVVNGDKIERSRIAVGSVSAKPLRLVAVEEIIKGQPANADVAKLAGQSSTRGARPLNYNKFKIPLMANLVTRAVRDATA